MAKILVAVSGLKGILFSSFGVLRRLEGDGHRVLLGSAKNVNEWTDANEIPFLQLPDIFLQHSLLQKIYRRILSILSEPRALETRIKDLKVDEIADIFEAEQFDLLLCDVEMHEFVLAAHKAKIKTILLSQWFNLAENHQVPVIQSLLNPEDKTDFSTDWAELKVNKRKSEKSIISRKKALLKKAKQLNFPTEYWQHHTWPPPFVYVNFPTISLTIEQLDFYPKEDYFDYIGPTIHENRKSPESKEFPIKQFLSKKENGSKIILVTVSTLKTASVEFIELFSKIAKEHSDWEIILNSTSEQLEKPENLHLFEFIPQLEILKIADLSINHGGIHTINECIHFRVPMIIISGDKHDQNGCAARCFYHGIAMETNSGSLESCINDCINNGSQKNSVQHFHQHYLEYLESKRLEEIVNQYLLN